MTDAKPVKIYAQLPGDSELLAAIGDVAIRHGQLDYFLRLTVKTLADLPGEQVLSALEDEPFAGVVELVRKLARQRFGQAAPATVRIRDLLTRCKKVTKRRNHTIHAFYAADGDGKPIVVSRGSHAELPTVEEVRKLARAIHDLASELNTERLKGFIKEAVLATKPVPLVQESLKRD
jgi:hypothetical protein